MFSNFGNTSNLLNFTKVKGMKVCVEYFLYKLFFFKYDFHFLKLLISSSSNFREKKKKSKMVRKLQLRSGLPENWFLYIVYKEAISFPTPYT